MPVMKRYISNDGVEHATLEDMRSHDIVADVDIALRTTKDDVRGWLASKTQNGDVRDALLRLAVRIARARPESEKRFRPTKAQSAAASNDTVGSAATTVAADDADTITTA